MSEYADAAGIVIGLDPVVLRIGPLSLRWYGLLLAIGLAVGIAVALRVGRRRELAEDAVWAAALVAIFGGIVGGRLLHVVDKLDYYLEHASETARLGPGGLSMVGAVLGGMLALALFARLRGQRLAPLLAVAAWGVLAGQVIGRIGSLVNGDSWGAPTDLPFSIVYTHPDAALPPSLLGVATQPYPVYEVAWNLVTLGALAIIGRRRAPASVEATVALGLFGVGRLILGAMRQENVVAFGLQQAQVVAAAIMLISVPYLVYLLTVRRRPAVGDSSEDVGA